MKLSPEERIQYVFAVWQTFMTVHHVKREASNTEWWLARGWANRGVPLAVVLQGITETTGEVHRLGACERAIEENIQRWYKAAGLSESPPANWEPPL